MAEKQAGLTIESVIVNVSSGRLGSQTFSASVLLGGQKVEKADLAKVLRSVNEQSVQKERSIIHALPIGFSLDGQRGVLEPFGMVGEKLGVDVAVISAETLSMRNIELALNACHIQVQAYIATPYASGLAVLVDDEAQLGVACVDFGANTTSVSVFSEGKLVYCDAIALGGHHISLDIARSLSISIEDAERIKTVYASVLSGQLDERELIAITPIGADEGEAPNAITRSALNRIVRPRVEEILNAVRDRLSNAGMMDVAGRRFVLTGGASELTGLSELATRMLSRHVRMGRPMGIASLPQMAKGASFATVAGMLVYPQICQHEFIAPNAGYSIAGNGGYLSRVVSWLRQSFQEEN
jgi:cell division protein FtsA